MNKKLVLLLLLFSVASINAQVAINTKLPQGQLHIDALGNNSTTGVPSAAQLTDDIIIKNDGAGGVSFAIGGAVVPSASVALLNPKRGFVPNTVSLTSTSDATTVPSRVEGMIVYNKSKTSDVIPGYYCYVASTAKWTRIASRWIDPPVTKTTLQAQLTVSTAEGILNFGTLKADEVGAFVFSLNLVGVNNVISDVNKVRRAEFQIFLYRVGVGTTAQVLLDNALITIPMFTKNATFSFSYNTFLIGEFLAGDTVIIKIKAVNTNSIANIRLLDKNLNSTELATSLVYWRIK